MTYKIHKKRRTKDPLPLPEAIPGRGDKPWEIKSAPIGHAQCRFSEAVGGSLAVPLTTDNCDECGKNHAAAARLHEMAHATISPDPSKVRTTFTTAGTKFDVTNEAVALAEELRADYYANHIAAKRQIEYDTDCVEEDVKYMANLIDQHDFKTLAEETLARSGGRYLLNYALQHTKHRIGEARDKGDDKTVDRLVTAYGTAAEINRLSSDIKEFSRKQYHTNIKSWTRQLHVGYAIDQFLAAVNDQIEQFNQNLKDLKEAQSKSNEAPGPAPNGDLQRPRDRLGKPEDGAVQFVKNLVSGQSFKNQLRTSGKLIAEEKIKDEDNSAVQWGKMDLETPKLSKRLPIHRRGWKPKASDEGAIPLYMHRWPIDQAIFKAKRREQSGSVLIDVSGSMSLSTEQIEEIVLAAPAGIVGIYSGWRTTNRGSRGIVRIIVNKGKYFDARHIRFNHDMGAGNEIDKPALLWLAKQPLPRIWVSDGYVVSPNKGYSLQSWNNCEQVILANRINRVDNPKDATLALEGKLALWR